MQIKVTHGRAVAIVSSEGIGNAILRRRKKEIRETIGKSGTN
jgi:hypothetical protein